MKGCLLRSAYAIHAPGFRLWSEFWRCMYAKDNLQFWARYQNDSSKNGLILAWAWVLAKSKQTFTFFRGQTFLKMNLQGDDDDDDDDDQTFLIAINMNLQGSHRETQRHSRTACGPSSNPKFKTILTHFMWYVPSPSFFLQSPSSHAEKLVPLVISVQGNADLEFVKKFTRPNFQVKEFYTLKMRKSRQFLPAINS